MTHDFAPFAEFATNAVLEEFSGELKSASLRALIDWYSATVVGAQLPPAEAIARVVAIDEAPGESSIIPAGRRQSARSAALVNGAASHAAELDDIYRDGIFHPGSPTIAAAIAIGQHVAATGPQLLSAIALGYELGARVSRALQPSHYARWHTTGTVGTLAAAAAAGSLLNLSASQYAHALSTAATMASGLQQGIRLGSMSKALHAGKAAESGVTAALLAAEGFTGSDNALRGEGGFADAMSEARISPDLWSGLGETWSIHETTVKNHACCGHTFAAIDAALELRREGLDIHSVTDVMVDIASTAIDVASNPTPQTASQARFSIEYCVAAALVLGSVRIDAFSEESLHDAKIHTLTDLISTRPDPEYSAVFPGRRAARVTIGTRDGQQLVRERLTRKGDPDDPLTDRELSEKFHDLVAPVVGASRAREIESQLWSVGSLADVRDLPTTEGRP